MVREQWVDFCTESMREADWWMDGAIGLRWNDVEEGVGFQHSDAEIDQRDQGTVTVVIVRALRVRSAVLSEVIVRIVSKVRRRRGLPAVSRYARLAETPS